MTWLVPVLFLLPLVALAFTLPRVIRFARLLQDPEQMAARLSQHTRQALAQAGLDPDRLDAVALRKSPELARMVREELHQVFRAELLGSSRFTAGTRLAPPAAGRPLELPAAIDTPSGLGPRLALVLALAALLGAAALLAS